ncbi:MAG: hypothetical protein WB760_25115, partial [Xanthobacteraceae bacterium]
MIVFGRQRSRRHDNQVIGRQRVGGVKLRRFEQIDASAGLKIGILRQVTERVISVRDFAFVI